MAGDDTSPTGDAFPSQGKKVPDGFDTKNDLKRDSAMRYGNLAKSYSSPLNPITRLVKIKTTPMDSEVFRFVCMPNDGARCTKDIMAEVVDKDAVMYLCPTFFAEMDPKEPDFQKAIKKILNVDKKEYITANKERRWFDAPQNPSESS